MDVSRYCKLAPLNWEALSEIESRLLRHSLTIEKCSVGLFRFPDHVTLKDLQAAYADVKKNGAPDRYSVTIYTNGKGKDRTIISIRRDWTLDGEEYLKIDTSDVEDHNLIESLSPYLGLESDALENHRQHLEKTVFIAYRFDDLGNTIADRVARFFELLGFKVVTGRSYAAGPISEKVRLRLEAQAVVVAIATPGDDPTWLAQESILASIKEKPLFLLKEETAQFKPALLADHEFIRFRGAGIEGTFIQILEGLRELGYFKSERTRLH